MGRPAFRLRVPTSSGLGRPYILPSSPATYDPTSYQPTGTRFKGHFQNQTNTEITTAASLFHYFLTKTSSALRCQTSFNPSSPALASIFLRQPRAYKMSSTSSRPGVQTADWSVLPPKSSCANPKGSPLLSQLNRANDSLTDRQRQSQLTLRGSKPAGTDTQVVVPLSKEDIYYLPHAWEDWFIVVLLCRM